MSDKIEAPYALFGDPWDKTGRLDVVTLTRSCNLYGRDTAYYGEFPDGVERPLDPRGLLTRCESKAQMQALKTVLDQAWVDSGPTLERANAEVAEALAKPGLDTIIDVPATMAKVSADFAEKRQALWKAVLGHIAKTPIVPVVAEFA